MSLTFEKAVQEDLNVGTAGDVDVTSPSGGSLTGTQIGLHTFAVGQVAYTKTWDPDSMAAGSSTSTTVTVPGAVIGDHVLASHAGMLTNDVQISAHVSAADTVTVVLSNPTAGAIDVGSATLSVLVFKTR